MIFLTMFSDIIVNLKDVIYAEKMKINVLIKKLRLLTLPANSSMMILEMANLKI